MSKDARASVVDRDQAERARHVVQSIFVPRSLLTLWFNVSGFIDIGVKKAAGSLLHSLPSYPFPCSSAFGMESLIETSSQSELGGSR